MSETNNLPPQEGEALDIEGTEPVGGGPISRPAGDGLPPAGGGLAPPGRGDVVDPAPPDGGALGGDVPGMGGER